MSKRTSIHDPQFAAALASLLAQQQSTVIPTDTDLAQAALITSNDWAMAAAQVAAEQGDTPTAEDWATLAAILTGYSTRMRANTLRYRQGEMTPAAWNTAQMGAIKGAHLAAAVLAYGGPSTISLQRTLTMQQVIRQQYQYQRNFLTDVLQGRQVINGRMDTRAGMYAAAARGTYTALSRLTDYQDGAKWERNVLGATDHHCPDCRQQADLGWVPIGTLSAPGTRRCRANCQCSIETRDSRPQTGP